MSLGLDDALKSETTWSDGYYNAIKFYFWEPELLGKLTLSQVRKAALAAHSSAEVVKALENSVDGSPGMEARSFERIKRTEEPFNHQLELFLRLAPTRYFDAMLNAVSEPPFSTRPHVLTRIVQLVWRGTQPDVLMLSETEAVAIEVKPPHGKSFDGQLAKYAFLFRNLVAERPNLQRKHLIFLANGRLADITPRKYGSIEEYKQRERDWARARTAAAFRRLQDDEIEEICDLIEQIEPKMLSFGGFFSACEGAATDNEAETLLLAGLRQELVRRDYL